MIVKSFILQRIVSFCTKKWNSVVVVGLYYGFLTVFSIGPSYFFLLRAWVMEEGTEKKVAATTGFIMGQLIMFISIYYAPLHLALGKPHTITVLYLPYLLMHFVLNNTNKEFLNSELTRNSMRNLSIQCVFLNHLIFQLFNHFLLPSSISVRLVNIYMFRCNNKIFFIISSFFGWLIGQIFLLKWIELVLAWLNSNKFIQLSILKKSLLSIRRFLRGRIVLEWRDSMRRIFTVSLFVISLYHLGKAPSPIFTYKFRKQLKKSLIKKGGLEMEDEEELEDEEKKEINEEIERTSKMDEKEQDEMDEKEQDEMDEKEQEVFSEENYSERGDDSRKMDEREEIGTNGKENRKDEFHKNERPFETSYPGWDEENLKLELFEEKIQDKKDKDLFEFNKKAFVTILFDSKRWNRPLRYIKNGWFEDAVRNEMSQYFFHTCQSDGKERISFTYPPSLSIFLEMIKKKISRFTTEKLSHNELYNNWILTNEQKKNNLSNKILKGAEALDKGFTAMNVLEKRIRLCNDEIQDDGIQKIYLPEIYDPLLNGPYRGRIKESFLPPKDPLFPETETPVLPETPVKDHISINKIHGLLLTPNYPNPNYPKFEQKEDLFSIKPLPTEICFFLLNLINQFSEKSTFKLEDQMRIFKLLVDTVRIDLEDETIVNGKGSVGIKEISKKVPKWSYKLRDELELTPQEDIRDFQLRTRACKVVLIKDNPKNKDEETDNTEETKNSKETENSKETDKKKKMKKEEKDFVVRYRKRSDFGRELIRGSMRAQRRKTVTWRMFLQLHAHSPLFIDRTGKLPYFNFILNSNLKPLKIFFFIFNKWMGKKAEFQISDSPKEKIKEGKKKEEFQTEEDDEATLVTRAESWELYSIYYGQGIRGVILLIQSIFRKRILFPSLIIAKNILRMLLFEPPEWSEDFEDLNKERYIVCSYDGRILPGPEFPQNWITEGLQIKILFPFRLKPWHKEKDKDAMKKEVQEESYCFLTVFGKEAKVPFGSPLEQPSCFRPVWKQLRKMKKWKRNRFLVLLNERIQFFLTVSKERTKWVIKNIPLIKKKIKELSKKNITSFFITKETKIYIYKYKKIEEEDSEPLTEMEQKTYHRAFQLLPRRRIPDHILNQMRSKLIELKKKELNAATERLINRKENIKKMKKNKKKRSRIPSININGKRFELQTNIWEILKILKRRKARLKRKSRRFIKLFIERLFIDNFLYVIKYVINALSINVKFFLESMKRIIEDKENREIIHKTNKRILRLFSTVSDPNSEIFRDVTYLSQAYVFFRLSQTPVINFYKLRSDFQYHGTSLFLKKKIKDYFVGIQGILNSELRYKTPGDSIMNQWKNWLRSHHQYNLSEIGWSKLVPKKWRKKIKRHLRKRKKINQDLRKRKKINQDLRKRKKINQDLRNEKKKNQDFLTKLVPDQKNTLKKKIYKYDLLSYIYNNNTAKGDYGYKSSLEANKMIFSNYNTHEDKPFDIPKNILLNNYGVKNEILIPDIEKALDRKNLDCRILNSISNREPCFFPKLLILYNTYRSQSWVIPIKLLLLDLDLNVNQNVGEKKVISSNENESKVGEESARSKMKGDREKKKKKPKDMISPEGKFLLIGWWRLQWKGEELLSERLLDKIEQLSIFLKLIDPTKAVLSSIKRRDLSVNLFGNPRMSKLIKAGIFIIEPVRLSMSINNGGRFLMYQTVAISLIHKSKNPIYQRYPERSYVDKKNSGKSVPRYQRMTENKDKNHSDLCVPENILCSRRRRELRILTSFNSRNRKSMHENTIYDNGNRVKKDCKVFSKNKDLDRDQNKLIKLKLFLWPNYQLEDLACMNRYWFNTNNSIHFSMIRIRMYPQLKN